MPMADSRQALSRVAFSIQSGDSAQQISRFDFAINPQNIQESTVARTMYLNTKNWGTAQELGMGQKTITISGTLGWRRGKGIDDSWNLKAFIEGYLRNFPNDGQQGGSPKLWFLNYTDNYQYMVVIAPNGYQFNQDVSQPLLIKYTINMIVIADKAEATSDERNKTVVGKPGDGGLSNGNVRPNTEGGPVQGAIANLKRHG